MAFRTNQVQVDGSINIDGSIFQWNLPFTGGGGSQWTTNGSAIYYNAGNVGIGFSSPQAPLHVQTADNFPQVRINASTGTTFPETGIRFRSSATATGIHADIFVKGVSVNETGRMGFRVPYTDERMSILSDGKIGIGTKDPSSSLHIFSDGGAAANFTISGSGEQGIRVLNTAGVGGIRNSMKWANRNDRDWTWITYTDTLATGVHDDWQLQNRNGVVINCSSVGRVGFGTSNFITRESSSGTPYSVQVPISMGSTASVFGMGLFGVPRFVFGDTNTGGNRINTAEIMIENTSLVEGLEGAKMHLRTKDPSGPQTTAITITPKQRVGVRTSDPSGYFHVYAPGGADPNFKLSGLGEQSIQLYNENVAPNKTTCSIKFANRNQTNWQWVIYNDDNNNGTEDFTLANRTFGTVLYCTSIGRVSIGGGLTPLYMLDVTGTIRSTGDMTATNFNLSSDEKLKTNVIPIKISSIDIEYKEFELLSQPGQKRYGVIAQELQKTNPELVRIDPEGLLNVAYIDLLIKEIASLKERVTELEKLKA